MEAKVLQAEYYTVVIEDGSGAANRMLSVISKIGISLLAYKSVSLGRKRTQFTLFAVRATEMSAAMRKEGLAVDGPFPGLFVEGEDVPGALADIFARLARADIVVEESSGIANIKGATASCSTWGRGTPKGPTRP